MNIENERKLALFAENALAIKKEIKWNEGHYLAALLSLSGAPQEQFAKTLTTYDMLKNLKMAGSDYLVMAAYLIAAYADPANYQNAATRTRTFYDEMKTKHILLTGRDDYIFAAMLGTSDLDTAGGAAQIEQFYRRLKSEFSDNNNVLALAQVLTLGAGNEEIVMRVLALRDAMKAQKIRLDKSDALPVLGVFSLLPVEVSAITRDIAEANNFLKAQKGFGAFSATEQERLIFAAAMVAAGYAADIKSGIITATVSTSIANIIIAQQMAMLQVCSTITILSAAAAIPSN